MGERRRFGSSVRSSQDTEVTERTFYRDRRKRDPRNINKSHSQMYRKWDAFVSSLSDSEEEEIILKAKQAHRQALIQMTVSREPSKPFRYGIGDFKDPKGVISLKQYYYEDYTEVAKIFVDLPHQSEITIHSFDFRAQSFVINLHWRNGELRYRFAIPELIMEIRPELCTCSIQSKSSQKLIVELQKLGRVHWPSLS